MAGEKTVSISFRVSPEFKDLLVRAAERQHRSQTNLLEMLLYRHCEVEGLLKEAEKLPEQPAQAGRVLRN